MRAADFTVTDGGTPLPPSTSRDDETRVAADASRIVAIYIDEFHLRDDSAFSAARIVEAAVPREDDLVPRSVFEQQFIATAATRIRATRRQITVSSLSALVSHLGSLPGGRQTLVLLRHGFSVPPGEPALPGTDALVGTANRELRRASRTDRVIHGAWRRRAGRAE